MPEGQKHTIVRAYMAHHQGMTIVAIANTLANGRMQTRFHAEPVVRATELLLEERMPREVVVSPPPVTRHSATGPAPEFDATGLRRVASPYTPAPATHVLSNGRYSVMISAAGGGYSRWGDIAITRWREDATQDAYGAYVIVRDVHSGAAWSAGHQPIGAEADSYQAAFSEDHVEISRRDGTITTRLDVLVSAEDEGEVRRVSITNAGLATREFELTSFAELALAPQAADAAHPAFSKLFVETEHLPAAGALLATRRRRSPSEPEIWVAHFAIVEGEPAGRPEFDTDRAQILGRGFDASTSPHLRNGGPLGGATGPVLDPAFALRRRIRVPPGGTARIAFWTLAASSPKGILDLIDKHHEPAAFERAADLAWTQALVQLHHLGVTRTEAALFQDLASRMIYPSADLRAPADILARGLGDQPGLWRVGISGDLPIIVLRVAGLHDLGVARQLVKAGEYWRTKQLAFDLVLLNERAASYVQDLQVALESLVRTAQARGGLGGQAPAGRTVVLRADLVADETRTLLLSVARVVLSAQEGTLAEQLERVPKAEGPRPATAPSQPTAAHPPAPPPPKLEFFNGLGGFDQDGREYCVLLEAGQTTPAPWINVVANPEFGFQVSADGAGYTWRRNSREHQLTPWSNDPVCDPTGEASICATRRPARSGRRPRPRFASRTRPISPGTVTATAASRLGPMASKPSCFSSCRSIRRSRSCGCGSATPHRAAVGSPSPPTPNGRWARHGLAWRRSRPPAGMTRRGRSLPATLGTQPSDQPSRSPIWGGDRRAGRPTDVSSSAATVRSGRRPRCGAPGPCRAKPAPGWIPVLH